MELRIKAKTDFSFVDESGHGTSLKAGEEQTVSVGDLIGGWLTNLAAKVDGPIDISGVEKVDPLDVIATMYGPENMDVARESLQAQADLRANYLSRKRG